MARKIVHLPLVAPETWDTDVSTGIGEAGARAAFEEIRNAIRSDLAALGVKVSDISTWTVGSYRGMMFECHDVTRATSFYFMSGYSTGAGAPDIDDVLGSNTGNLSTVAFYFQSSITASVLSAAGLFVGANPDTTVSRADLDYDDTAELTYSGGDWTSLSTIDPNTLLGIQAVFPSHCTLAASDTSMSNYRVSRCLGYDNTEGVWLYAVNDPGSSEYWALWGPLLDPSADANEYATLLLSGSNSTAYERGISHQQLSASAFDAGGTRRTYDLVPDNDLDKDNYIVTGGAHDGKLTWKKVEVANGSGGSGIKGHVKEQYLVEIGIYRGGSFYRRPIKFPTADTPVLCITEGLAIWWEDGQRMFPSYYLFNL